MLWKVVLSGEIHHMPMQLHAEKDSACCRFREELDPASRVCTMVSGNAPRLPSMCNYGWSYA